MEEIKKASEELSKVAQRVGGELYKQSPPSPGATAGETGEPKQEPQPNPENEIPEEDPHK